MTITSGDTSGSRAGSRGRSGPTPVDTSEWEALLGGQVRALRLEAGLDQAGLASLADLSLTAVKNLENGRGSTLRTLVRLLRALDRADWLTTLAPAPTVSPLDLLRSSSAAPRRRVYRSRKAE